MAFPANLTVAVDGVTDVVADHLNNLESKVGIDGSLVTTSLDYLLKNSASVDPGHKHTRISISGLLQSDISGLPDALAAKLPLATYQDSTSIDPGHRHTRSSISGLVESDISGLVADLAAKLPVATYQNPASVDPGHLHTRSSISGLLESDISNLVPDLAAKLPTATYTNASSIDPGHRHINLYKPDGSGIALSIDSNGNVGIGTTSPGSPLQIVKTGSGTQIPISITNNQAAAANVGTNFRWSGVGDVTMGSLVNAWEGAATSDAFTAFYTRGSNNNTEKMRITSAGIVGIGTASPNAAALLHLSSTTKGFLPPVMTTTQKGAISNPPAGLVIYDSTLNKLCVFTGTSWQTITSL